MMPITPEQLAKADTEHAHQTALMCWASLMKHNYPQLAMLFAIPNGGERNKIVAAKMVAEGVRQGVPDTFLAVPAPKDNMPLAGYYHGLFIEMKKPSVRLKRAPAHKWDTGGVSTEQIWWLTELESRDYKCVVCYSWEEAAKAIMSYLLGRTIE